MIAAADRIVDCEQGTGAWLQARLGCVSASRIRAVMAKPKRVTAGQTPTELAPHRDLRFELACELITGNAAEHFQSEWMKRGTELEPLARAEYEIRFNCEVAQIGFIYHPTIPRAGASPDGLVGSDGLIEIKCPKPETHLQYLADDVIPEDYLPQMTWQLACYETRQWNDFVSYCPAMPEKYQIFRKRLERTKVLDDTIRGMELEVIAFNESVDELLRRIKGQ